ncbi:hypothetical protein HJG54_10000 [Leptolyngbya sp. NK1-12]|uniref:Uncharacterized protein n=1 Tax=Leptolyngbya sp. NK1-12 TaxID=2547451 RepID=A0AA96WDJ8_9CYAN|nr:hypothetical protein [Leptolyngbya sp. NK1-12]WNZ23154.1 hypothetical protein HJG54_10000 [Leptolyngbya sp. NK1-12]
MPIASIALMPSPSGGNKNLLERLWHEIEQQVKEKLNLTKQDLEINSISYQEYSRLNKQALEVSLLRKLIEILTSGAENKSQDIDKVLEILQQQEDQLSLNLRQVRKRIDPDLGKVQDLLKIIEKSPVELDYERINAVLNSLVGKFTLASKPSQEQAEDLLEELRQIIVDNPHNINTSRIGTLINVLQLLKWIAATEYSKPFEYEFKTEFDSARKHKAIELLVEQSLKLLKAIIKNSDDALNSIRLGIEKQWIAEVLLYGFNSKDLAVVELALEIDWNKFNKWRNHSVSDGMVKVRWGNQPIEISKITSRFNNVLESNDLSAGWRVAYRSDIDEEEANEINQILGFRNSPVNWEQQGLEAQEETMRVQDLSELDISLNFKPRKRKRYS